MTELNPTILSSRQTHGPAYASPKSPELANHGSRVSRNMAALVPVIERIASLEYQAPDFRSADELKAAFVEADREVKATAKAASDSQAGVIIALAKVRAILSQRGKEKMRCEAGIKLTWTGYYRWFQKEFNFELTLRAVQYKIAELSGKKRKRNCAECQKTAGHSTSCSKHKEPTPPHLTPLEAKLLHTASSAHGIVKAVRHGGNLDEAIAEFEQNAPTPEKLIEYAERSVKPSLTTLDFQPSKQSSNGLDHRGMLIDLLDQVEKLGPRLPIELHVKCKQFRTSIGLPPNVVSDPNWNTKAEQEEASPNGWEMQDSVTDWDHASSEEINNSSEVDAIEY